MEHTESVEGKWAVVAQPCNGKRPVIGTSGAGLFQKCPSVDTHSGVTLQQTYYLLFCHFGFSTCKLGTGFNFSTRYVCFSDHHTSTLSFSPSLGVSPQGEDGAFKGVRNACFAERANFCGGTWSFGFKRLTVKNV